MGTSMPTTGQSVISFAPLLCTGWEGLMSGRVVDNSSIFTHTVFGLIDDVLGAWIVLIMKNFKHVKEERLPLSVAQI